MNVLIVEDDESVARFLKQAVSEAGYAPVASSDGREAVSLATTMEFDLILLDLMLPGLDGFSVCRRLRSERVVTPILMITARDRVEDKIAGLDEGADDYIVKPFQVGELLARMRALLRRGSSAPSSLLHAGELVFDPASRKVSLSGRSLSLSSTEYSLLEYFMRNVGRVLTRSMILDHVWGYDFNGNDNILDVYISYLRSKIDRDRSSSLIQTVRGVGYRMDAP